MPERPYMKLARLWSRAYRRPLSDLEHASMDALQSEYEYVCDRLAECFKDPCCDDLAGELAWYRDMNDWLQRLRRVHHEYGTRRHVANELRRKENVDGENI